MEENLIFEFKTTRHSREISIRLAFVDSINEHEFGTLVYEASQDGNLTKVTFTFDLEELKITNQMNAATTTCLLLCGVNTAGPILDCLRKNPSNWKKFKKCVKEQGVSIAANAVTCVAACFAGGGISDAQ